MHLFKLIAGEGPIVAAAIHAGHAVRPEVAERLIPDDAQRLREEDPFTDVLTEVAPTQIVGLRSRFEVDLNRPREQAVYLKPEDCWGIDVCVEPPPREVVSRSLANYDLLYATVDAVLRQLVKAHGLVVVLDIHSYNHRRDGADKPSANPEENPEVNVGTGTMDRQRWAPIVDGFMEQLRSYDYLGRQLDVRENVRFRGGNFSRWIHETFPTSVCSLAVEFKKTFMDEWTGEVTLRKLAAMKDALSSTLPRLLETLGSLNCNPVK